MRGYKQKGVSNISESKVSVSAEWLVQIGWTWEELFEVLGTWDDKLSESKKKKRIYTNKIRSNQAISNGWDRKEMYMPEKDNMTRHIKFLSYWIKTIIPLFTFTITKKDTNNVSRGQLTAFYMKMKNETNTTKNSKEGIIRGIPI